MLLTVQWKKVSNRQAEPLLRREDDLHAAYWNVPTGDMLIAAGNWNARPGPVDTATR